MGRTSIDTHKSSSWIDGVGIWTALTVILLISDSTGRRRACNPLNAYVFIGIKIAFFGSMYRSWRTVCLLHLQLY